MTPSDDLRPPPRPPARRRRRGGPTHTLWPYLLLAPFLCVFVAFFVAPVGLSVGQSLFRDRMIGGPVFVGPANFVAVLSDESFWAGVARIGFFALLFIPATLSLALLLALALDDGRVRWGSGFSLAFFLPYAIPGVVASIMWGFLYGPIFGPLNGVIRAAGFGGIDFLSADVLLFSIGNIDLWLYVGYVMIVLSTALKTVPSDVLEAAIVDGASRWRVARSIKVPLIVPTFSVMLLFSIIGTLQLFTEPAVLRPLAPAVIGNDYVPNFYAYWLASTGQQFNYVSALSIVLAALVLVVSSASLLLFRRPSASRP